MKKDPNYAIKVEKAIAKKYGEETIQNPKKNWDDDKEKKYLSQIKECYNANTHNHGDDDGDKAGDADDDVRGGSSDPAQDAGDDGGRGKGRGRGRKSTKKGKRKKTPPPPR